MAQSVQGRVAPHKLHQLEVEALDAIARGDAYMRHTEPIRTESVRPRLLGSRGPQAQSLVRTDKDSTTAQYDPMRVLEFVDRERGVVWVGKRVQLRGDLQTRGGVVFRAGETLVVVGKHRGRFRLRREKDNFAIGGVGRWKFQLDDFDPSRGG